MMDEMDRRLFFLFLYGFISPYGTSGYSDAVYLDTHALVTADYNWKILESQVLEIIKSSYELE